jgi:hypothetical protein
MIRVSLSGEVWLEDGPANRLEGPPSMHFFDVDGPEDDPPLYSGASLEPGIEYSVWPDGTDSDEFRIKFELNEADPDEEIFFIRDGDADDWREIKASAPINIDRRKTVWDRLLKDDE